MSKSFVSKAHNSAERDLLSWIRFSDVVCSVAFALLCAMSVLLLSSEPSTFGCDIAGVLFIVIAGSYRGSGVNYFTTLVPVGLLVLFLPVAHWESTGALEAVGGILRASIVPGLSFLGGTLLITLRATRAVSIEGSDEVRRLSVRGYSNIRHVKKMGHQMENILKSISQVQPRVVKAQSAPARRNGWELVEFQIDDGQLIPAIEANTMSHSDIAVILSTEMDLLSAVNHRHQGLRLSFSAPQDVRVPLAVRGQIEILREVIRDVLQRSIDSLGQQQGLVRMTLRPTRSSVEISIEDNGRGLNEELIVKLEAKGFMKGDGDKERKTLAEIRMLVEASGWKMHMQARLGVGARLVIELPRVDQGFAGARADRARDVLRAGTIVDPSAVMDGWVSASDVLN